MAVYKTRIPLFLSFWKSTLIINIPVSVAIAVIASFFGQKGFAPLAYLHTFLKVFCTLGLALGIYFVEKNRKNQYYFYYNGGFSKLQLILGSFVFNCIISVILALLCQLLYILLK